MTTKGEVVGTVIGAAVVLVIAVVIMTVILAVSVTEDCKLVVTSKMQNRNVIDKLNHRLLAQLLKFMVGYTMTWLISLSVAFLFRILQGTTCESL